MLGCTAKEMFYTLAGFVAFVCIISDNPEYSILANTLTQLTGFAVISALAIHHKTRKAEK